MAVALPVFNTYTYLMPEELQPYDDAGKRVLIPFGRRRVTGYILGATGPLENIKAKAVLAVLAEKPLLPATMIPFYRWVADYYLYPLGQVIKTSLPSGLSINDYVTFELTDAGRVALDDRRTSPNEKAVLHQLSNGKCRQKDICKPGQTSISPKMIRSLTESGKIMATRQLFGKNTKPQTQRMVQLATPPNPQHRLSNQRKQILEALANSGSLPVKSLSTYAATAPQLVKSMAAAGWVTLFEKPVYRDPFGETIAPDVPPVPTVEQEAALDAVLDQLGKGFSAFLLAGVTGSGKTEVYLKAAAATIERDATVLVLVPEIALISQMERRFRARFGETVAILHSGLTAGERLDQWLRILDGKVKIVVGARSAIFAPIADLGLIIVDEEHDPSYKQETNLRYNARDLAVMRAKESGAVALLGSATPSIQSYYNVEKNKFRLLTLTERVQKRPMPKIHIVDLRDQKGWKGVAQYITPQLHQAMKHALSRGEQVLLFLNRRGYANFPVCRACGDNLSCKNCDISLTLHKKSNAFRCHFCGYSRAAAQDCPTCGSHQIHTMGIGTEKVEAGVRQLFPQASVVRMDRDTTQRKGAMIKMLKGLKERTIDVLIGTQMVAKGHDFPNITVVGIVCADLSLSFPDFRAGERTYQLLAQVAGRAGRGDTPGQVILQTYSPEHFSIMTAKAQDYMAFYDHEIGFRKALRYPPYSRLIQMRIAGRDKERTGGHATACGECCRELVSLSKYKQKIEVWGPIEAPLNKIASHYRFQILLKGSGAAVLHQFSRELMRQHAGIFSERGIRVVLDVDPFDML